MMMEKIKYLREAASVRRCHTTPHIGEYNIGYHSFNMLAMLRLLWPNAPIRLVWAILEHDIPERRTGDIPAPAKWQGFVDNGLLDIVEREILTGLFGYSSYDELEPDEICWLKGLDLLELFMWCRDQMNLGNQNATVMGVRIMKFVEGNKAKFPPLITDLFFATSQDAWIFTPDFGD